MPCSDIDDPLCKCAPAASPPAALHAHARSCFGRAHPTLLSPRRELAAGSLRPWRRRASCKPRRARAPLHAETRRARVGASRDPTTPRRLDAAVLYEDAARRAPSRRRVRSDGDGRATACERRRFCTCVVVMSCSYDTRRVHVWSADAFTLYATTCYELRLYGKSVPPARTATLRPRRAHIPLSRAHNVPPPFPGERGELLRADLAAAGFPSSLQPLIVLDALRAYRRPLARSALAGGMVDEPRGERAAGPRLEVLHAAPDARLPLLRRGRRSRRWCGCRLLRRTGDARPFVSAHVRAIMGIDRACRAPPGSR